MQSIVARTGDMFIGEAGAILNGAKVLTPDDWTFDGTNYVVTGQTQENDGRGTGACQGGYAPACTFPEDLFFDGVPLEQVASLDQLAPGRWYFDYAADRIHFRDDPNGALVETSVTPRAIEAKNNANGVTVENLIIEKYANRAQASVVHALNSDSFTIRNCEIRSNHGVAIGVGGGTGSKILENHIHHNGQLGIGGFAPHQLLVTGNTIAYNNYAKYDHSWEAGGVKLVKTQGLTLRNNYVHHNDGKGLWNDNSNLHTIYEGNLVEDNTHTGIFHEIACAAIIRDNVVRRNGSFGIVIDSSPNVDVHRNTLSHNGSGRPKIQGDVEVRNRRLLPPPGPHCSFGLSNVRFRDNTITPSPGTFAAHILHDATLSEIRFENNTYHLEAAAQQPFRIDWTDLTAPEWRAAGRDVDGVFHYPSTPPLGRPGPPILLE